MTYSKPPVDETRPHKAMVVDGWSPATWDQWIRRTSRADDGRDPAD